ncbi:hypothetical protein EC973_001423 [Apophysomyces ossiformis]|uniref:Uncharacterized protein n=1 Tax=Apophysomyces ossiformis TaxID=679940 RepID=A0A8H7BQ35_9FUNG|nr:hypothetical protein EC973_001423 [Apophysomyces ossiformis]
MNANNISISLDSKALGVKCIQTNVVISDGIPLDLQGLKLRTRMLIFDVVDMQILKSWNFYAKAYADEHVLHDFCHCLPDENVRQQVDREISQDKNCKNRNTKVPKLNLSKTRIFKLYFLKELLEMTPRITAWPGQVLYFFHTLSSPKRDACEIRFCVYPPV